MISRDDSSNSLADLVRSQFREILSQIAFIGCLLVLIQTSSTDVQHRSSTPLLTAKCETEIPGGEKWTSKESEMETLPVELNQRILSLLSYRHLASAARVCRTWKTLTSHAELWRSLYVRRWGQDKAAREIVSLSLPNSWKFAYEVEDRCDRIGMELTIVREGDNFYVAQKGLLLRCIGCRRADLSALSEGSCSDSPPAVQSKTSAGCSSEMERTSQAGLLDKLLEVVAELHSKRTRVTKHPRIS